MIPTVRQVTLPGEAPARCGPTGRRCRPRWTDQVDLIERAIAAVPAAYRRDLLVSIDGAGASHAVVAHLHGLNTAPTHGLRGRKINYSIEFDLDVRARTAIGRLPKGAWEPAPT